MSEREALLDSIAKTIQDYRNGILPKPITDHIDRWVRQFDADVQVPILREVNHVLQRTYFSKQQMMDFLSNLIHAADLAGNDPQGFWRSVNFLDIQGGGNSQRDMLVLFSEVLMQEFGFGIEACGQRDDVFIYLDDCIFTGNRVRYDLEEWIRNDAPAKAKVHVICIALHRGGHYYANQKIQEAILETGKNIVITWRRAIELEDRKAYTDRSDMLRPTFIPDDMAVQDYVKSLQHEPVLRHAGNPGSAGLFSSDEAKILLEQEFLKTGVRIRQMCPKLKVTHRPLGYMKLETLGFGSLIVTYRNCPNNAPLAFWVDDPWYPLFPRITNTQTAIERIVSGTT
jgi:hypothetical protein